ncbi:helix-turn-helix domain-containing protein [Nostoc sp. C117]|uniref:helix-turn-helix domain-containing protein n=1 Tax=Nostoc sp. C117 TaxID=3349875 RepID=UPI00370D85F4
MVDSTQENAFSDIFPSPPVLSSHKAAWSGIHLEYHCQPMWQTPDYCLENHVISINLGQTNRLERVIEGRFQKAPMLTGNVGLYPAHLQQRHLWDGNAEFLLLSLEEELVAHKACELMGTHRIELVPHLVIQDPLIQQIGLALKAELESDGLGGRLYVESMANALVIHLLRQYSTQEKNIPTYQGGLPQQKLKEVVDYIHNHLEQNLTLDELAETVQLSPHHFCRLFKQSTGFSPHQYVIVSRVERAKQLLLQRKMAIAEVAIACGFSHQSHFNRHFKRLLGVTPKAFRKS